MSLSSEIAPHLPHLRRYARALTGTQASGDAYVRATLEAIVRAPGEFPSGIDRRVGLFKIFHAIWSSSNVELPEPGDALTSFERHAQGRLLDLTPISRQALLLSGMEGLSHEEVAEVLGRSEAEVASLLAEALGEIDRQTRTNVLIIEDEPIISMDLEGIVSDLGHEVSNVATTHTEAVAAVKSRQPGLVLADIQLADGSSGIDAVHDILSEIEVPVIFITAFPDRLLTGERPEPTFLISKPFNPETVKATISQALFFGEAARAVA